MEKLGLGLDELFEINKKLIYTRLTGFGQEGELFFWYVKKYEKNFRDELFINWKYISFFNFLIRKIFKDGRSWYKLSCYIWCIIGKYYIF